MAKMMKKMSAMKSAMKKMSSMKMGMKRKMNQYMVLLQKAKKTNAANFVYNGKTYHRGMAGHLVVYRAKKK